MTSRRVLAWMLAAHFIQNPAASGQRSTHTGVRSIKNPFARSYLFPVEFDTARPIGTFGRVQDVVSFQPLIPFLLGPKWDLITQTNVSVVSQPDLLSRSGRQWGLADINTAFYFSPDNQKNIHWGLGPAFLFPTATSPAIGTGKFGAGPAGALVVEPGGWTLAVAVNSIKSFAGDSSRSDVHYTTFQYQVTHNFWRGWYLTSSPTAAADWTQPPGERWLVPVGLGIGNVFTLGHRHFGGEVSSYYSLIHPKTQPYPKWVFSLQLSFARSQ